jgi:hypothetical protein
VKLANSTPSLSRLPIWCAILNILKICRPPRPFMGIYFPFFCSLWDQFIACFPIHLSPPICLCVLYNSRWKFHKLTVLSIFSSFFNLCISYVAVRTVSKEIMQPVLHSNVYIFANLFSKRICWVTKWIINWIDVNGHSKRVKGGRFPS